jgi:enoyl-CoA hydratase
MSHVLTEVRDGVLWLTLNRPERRNAYSPEMVCRIIDAWEQLRVDDTVRAAVVTGAGGTFCSGADLDSLISLFSGRREPADDWDRRVAADVSAINQVFFKNAPSPKPVIAAIDGYAFAGGFELALGCDLRIATTRASFALSEPKRGLFAAGGGTARALRHLPRAVALELLLTGDPIGAQDALRHGLVSRLVEPDELLAEAERLARAVVANAPLSIAGIKRLADESENLSLAGALALESEIGRAVNQSHDVVEGTRAFFEKRPARWTGR